MGSLVLKAVRIFAEALFNLIADCICILMWFVSFSAPWRIASSCAAVGSKIAKKGFRKARLCMMSQCFITLFDLCVAPLCVAAFAFLWLLPGLLRDLHTEGWKGQEHQLNFRLLCLQRLAFGVLDLLLLPLALFTLISGVRAQKFASKFAAAWVQPCSGPSTLKAKLRKITICEFVSALLDIICIVICTPLLLMPWSWTSILPIYQHYKTRHIRNIDSGACDLWRFPFLKLLITSTAEAVLVSLCCLCIASPWKWSRIVSLLWKDGSRQEKRLVLLAAILSSTLDIVSLPIALMALILAPWNISRFCSVKYEDPSDESQPYDFLSRSVDRAATSIKFLVLALRDHAILLTSFICVVSLWRALPFIRKLNRRVTQSKPPTADTSPSSPSISEQDSFFSNATLRHALRQIVLLLRDIAIGFPALFLTVASLVRLPSFIANIASACLSRQISLSKPTARIRMFSLCVAPTTDFIRIRVAGVKSPAAAPIRSLSLDIIGGDFFDRVDDEWGQAAASLVQVSLPVKLQLPEQNTLNASLDFDVTCKLSFKSKRAVVLRSLQRLAASGVKPVQFCMQVLAAHDDGAVRVLCAVLVSIDEIIACIINDTDFTLPCESTSPAILPDNKTISTCPSHLHAPDAHPEVTKSILAFIGVPASDSSALPRAPTAALASVAPAQAASTCETPPRPTDPLSDSSVQTGSYAAPNAPSTDDVVDFDRDVRPFLLKQQLSQEERQQCAQDAIFFVSIAEAAVFLKNLAVFISFVVSCLLVPWRLPIVLSLLFKSNDTIKRYQAYHACCLMDLISIDRSEMLATSLQRMQHDIHDIRNAFSERDVFNQYASMYAITGCGRSQRVYEQLIHQMCKVLKHSDSDGSDAAQELLKAHNSSMIALQVHVAFYLNALHNNAATTTHRSSRMTPRQGQRPKDIAITNRTSVPFPFPPPPPPPPPAFSIENSAYSEQEMISTVQLTPDEACMRAVDQQARMATTVAAHFGRSEAGVVAAVCALNARKQQLKDEISRAKWAPSHSMKNMQKLVKIMLSWLLQDLIFAMSAVLVGISFYRLRFVVLSSKSRSFVCVRQMVVQQSVEVLLDFLAFLRFFILIISVHKLFDVCRDVFARNTGFDAVLLRSVIARHFRDLLDDFLWIIRPLYTFDWYRYVTAVAAYLVFIPLEMIAQILAPSRLTSADANALPVSNPKPIHYIFASIVWSGLFVFPFIFVFHIINTTQHNLKDPVTYSIAGHLALVVAFGWLCILRTAQNPVNLKIADASFTLHFSLANTEAIGSIVTDTIQMCILLLGSVSGEVSQAVTSASSTLDTMGNIFNLKFHSVSFEIMFWITVAAVGAWVLTVSAPIVWEDVLRKNEVGTICKLPIWRNTVSFFCTTLFIPIVSNLLQPLRCSFSTPTLPVLNVQGDVLCWNPDAPVAPLLVISQHRLSLLAMIFVAFFTASAQAVSVSSKCYGTKESPTLDVRYSPVYHMLLQSAKLCIVASETIFVSNRRAFICATLAVSLLAALLTSLFKLITHHRPCSITVVTGLRCLSFSLVAWTAVVSLVFDANPDYTATHSVLVRVGLPGWAALFLFFLVFFVVQRRRDIVFIRQREEQSQIAITRSEFMKAFVKGQALRAYLPSLCRKPWQLKWMDRVASARRIVTFLQLLQELEGGVRLEALALTSRVCHYIHDVSLNAATLDDAALHEMLRKAARQLHADFISQCNRFVPPQGIMQEPSVKFSVFQATCDAVKKQSEGLSLADDDAMTTVNRVKGDSAASDDVAQASNAGFSVLPGIATVTFLGSHLLLPLDPSSMYTAGAAV